MTTDRMLAAGSWTPVLIWAGLSLATVQASAAGAPEAGEPVYLLVPAIAAEPPAEEGPEAAAEPTPTTPIPPVASLHESLKFESVQLSYVDVDRALPLLGALGYTTIWFDDGGALASNSGVESIWRDLALGRLELPVVIRLPDAAGDVTTLVREAADGEPGSADAPIAGVPNIGGTAMPHSTSGEPQQRLLIVYQSRSQILGLLRLLRDEIDLPSRQLVIEALVVEINSDRLRDIGLELGAQGGDFAYSFGARTMGQFFSPFTLGFDDRGQGASFVSATLSALVAEGDAEILSNPSVLVLDGRQARIQIGQQIPVITSSANVNVVSASVSYFPVGIVLNLRPRINLDGSEVTMQVETIVSAISAEGGVESTTEGGLAVIAPTIDNRQVQSFVRVNNGTPFIIGGLISQEDRKRSSRVPGLSRVPLIGKLFRRRQRDRLNREVIILLTPHVVPEQRRHFSFLIPRPSELFDSLEHELFRNAYRIRDDDVWDLKAFLSSASYQQARAQAAGLASRPRVRRGLQLLESGGVWSSGVSRQTAELAGAHPEVKAALGTMPPAADPIAALEALQTGCLRTISTLLGHDLPGEAALVHRMLWEIATRHHAEFGDTIRLDSVRFFEPVEDGHDLKLTRVTEVRLDDPGHDAVLLDLSPGDERPALQEAVRSVRSEKLAGLEAFRTRLSRSQIVLWWRPDEESGASEADGLRAPWDRAALRQDEDAGSDDRRWAPENVLRNVLVVKRILELNPDLPLTVRAFYAGREIAFPTSEELRQSTHIIDRQVAGLYFDVQRTYFAFGEAYERQIERLTTACEPALGALSGTGSTPSARPPAAPSG